MKFQELPLNSTAFNPAMDVAVHGSHVAVAIKKRMKQC